MPIRKTTTLIVIHCSATPPFMDIGLSEIDYWHKQRGWNGVGYHDIIRRDGSLEFGRNINDVGAHVHGYNQESTGICMVGGVNENHDPENNFTEKQFDTLINRSLKFHKLLFPEAQIVGHNELSPGKACPSFDVQAWLKEQNLV